MATAPLLVLAVLALNVAASEWLARNTPLRHIGSALLVILLTAIVANIGLIPTYSEPVSPVYEGIFRDIAPLSIFLLLLQVHLRGILRAGLPMLILFLVGSLGTCLGVIVGMTIVGGESAFGESHFALGGMFVGTYTGGSINFNAIALEYGVVQNGTLYAGAAAVDSAMTTIWMAATVILPRLFGKKPADSIPKESKICSQAEADDPDRETTNPFHLAVLLAMGCSTVFFSRFMSQWTEDSLGWSIPSILILTTLALIFAQLRPIRHLQGMRVCGWLSVMLFLSVIGALCDVSALKQLGDLGPQLMLFVAITVCVHGLIVFLAATLFRLDSGMAAVASQANIGGGTSALAVSRSLKRPDLVLPSILIGSLGNAIGTYLGFLTAAFLR